tara:strand:+ start:1067 stop:1360 length:294 start_codon:yes stop_codon:yes gene_type:complete
MAKIPPPKIPVTIRAGKQTEIMKVIVKGNPDGSFVDIDQILERLSYTTTKPSLGFSLRSLVNKGLITRDEKLRKRDGHRRRVIKPTILGYELTKQLP